MHVRLHVPITGELKMNDNSINNLCGVGKEIIRLYDIFYPTLEKQWCMYKVIGMKFYNTH